MRQKIIKRIFALSMVGAMAFALVACATTSSQDEPSKANQGQEAELSSASPTQEPQPTPTPSEEPTPSQDTSPMPNEDESSEAMPNQEPAPTQEPQEPITTQEPTQSQEPIQTQAPTTTSTPPPTTPPTSTPIHTHSFKGGDCSTPSICDCGEIGGYGDHEWITIHIDEYGYYEKGETHSVRFKQCDCGFTVNSDMPNATTIWDDHMIATMHSYITWREDVPNGEPKYIVVVEEHDEAYCSICGAIQ